MIKAYRLDRVDNVHWERGAKVAAQRGYVPNMAAFLVNLDKPTENPQHKDLLAAEDFLIGYYETILAVYKEREKELFSRERNAIIRAEKAEEILDAYKSRQSGSVKSRSAVGANRRPARRNPRRD
jgi:hypothetical protein